MATRILARSEFGLSRGTPSGLIRAGHPPLTTFSELGAGGIDRAEKIKPLMAQLETLMSTLAN